MQGFKGALTEARSGDPRATWRRIATSERVLRRRDYAPADTGSRPYTQGRRLAQKGIGLRSEGHGTFWLRS